MRVARFLVHVIYRFWDFCNDYHIFKLRTTFSLG